MCHFNSNNNDNTPTDFCLQQQRCDVYSLPWPRREVSISDAAHCVSVVCLLVSSRPFRRVRSLCISNATCIETIAVVHKLRREAGAGRSFGGHRGELAQTGAETFRGWAHSL